jgi:hypothetical protein
MATVKIVITDTDNGIKVAFCMNTEGSDGEARKVNVKDATVSQLIGWGVIEYIKSHADLAAETRQKLDSGMSWEQIRRQQDLLYEMMP